MSALKATPSSLAMERARRDPGEESVGTRVFFGESFIVLPPCVQTCRPAKRFGQASRQSADDVRDCNPCARLANFFK